MRTCAEKLALQLSRRRERLIAAGITPRRSRSAATFTDAAALGEATAADAIESGGNAEAPQLLLAITNGERHASPSRPGAAVDGLEHAPEAGPPGAAGPDETQVATAAGHDAASAGRAAAAAALGIQAAQVFLTAEFGAVTQEQAQAAAHVGGEGPPTA